MQTGTATFAFSGSDNHSPVSALTFQCKLDTAAFAACTSPKSYTGLIAGPHTFEVRAVDQAGNVDASPASHTWNIADTTPPDTNITSQPANPTTNTSASFGIGGSDNLTSPAALTFECRIDSSAPGDWASCTNPKAYHGLSVGPHTFEVRAVDGAGLRDPSPASYTWSITAADTTPPDTSIDTQPPVTTTDTNASFTFSSPEPGVTFQCKLDTAAFAACTTRGPTPVSRSASTPSRCVRSTPRRTST